MKQKRLIMMLAVLAAGGHHGSHAVGDGIF